MSNIYSDFVDTVIHLLSPVMRLIFSAGTLISVVCIIIDHQDGCFTSDSDAFLFGAKTVYRDICLGE